MVSPEQLDRTFAALADPTRRRILEQLTLGEATVGELAAPLDISGPAVTKHLRTLERAGLLQRRREGRHQVIELDAEPMKLAREWIEYYRRFWEGSLDSLADYLERGVTKQDKAKHNTSDEHHTR